MAVSTFETQRSPSTDLLYGQLSEYEQSIGGFAAQYALDDVMPSLASQVYERVGDAELYVHDVTCGSAKTFKEMGAAQSMISAMATGIREFSAASAGNHGLGMAHGAINLGVHAHIMLPHTVAETKSRGLLSLSELYPDNVSVGFYGDNVDETVAHTASNQAKYGNFIHPFANTSVINGQGYAFLSIVRAGLSPDATITPFGGGGLSAGTAEVRGYLGMTEQTTLVFTQAAGSNSGEKSCQAGEVVAADQPNSLCGGSRVLRTDPVIVSRLSKLANKTFATTTNEELAETARLYDYDRRHGRSIDADKNPLEPTSLQAFGLSAIVKTVAELKNKGRSKPSVVLVATGRNDTLDQLLKQ